MVYKLRRIALDATFRGQVHIFVQHERLNPAFVFSVLIPTVLQLSRTAGLVASVASTVG